jgi:2-alkyl-3-oxoalkanoate reductase
LGERSRVIAAMKGADAVIHTAAKADIWGDYADFYQANVIGTENILAACAQWGIQKLVDTSSPSVVHPGHGGLEGVDETIPYPDSFDAHYPKTKAIAEQMVLNANSSQLATVALRPHLIWGPGDPHFVPRLSARAKAGKLRLIGSPDPLIETGYVDNAADAHLLALDRLEIGSAIAGKAYFITQDEPLPISAFANRILHAAGIPPVTRRVPVGIAQLAGALFESAYRLLPLKGEPQFTRFLVHQTSTPHWFDISAARRDLGYNPKVGLDEGMLRLKQHLQ